MGGPSKSVRLNLDEDVLMASPLRAAFEIMNGLSQINLEIRTIFGLRPVDMAVLHVLMLAAAQKVVRQPSLAAAIGPRMQVPDDLRGTMSRRAASRALELPFETVRRSVARLKTCGLVEERRRGKLVVTDRVIAIEGIKETFASVAGRWIAVADRLVQLGVVRVC